MIEVSEVSLYRGERAVLAGATLQVRRGTVHGLLGPNGAGKSTLLTMIAGLLAPSAGSVRVFGVDPVQNRELITRRVGVQPQSAALFPTLTVRETLRLFGAIRGSADDPSLTCQRAGLERVADTRCAQLSGGEQRRLLIELALLGSPEIVLLDEPSASLDVEGQDEIVERIRDLRDRGVTVLFTTHHLAEAAELCEDVTILASGRVLASGSPDSLAQRFTSLPVVSFTIAADVPIEDAWRSHGEVVVEPAGDRTKVSISTTFPDDVLRWVTFAHHIKPRDVRVHVPTLQDAYRALLAIP